MYFRSRCVYWTCLIFIISPVKRATVTGKTCFCMFLYRRYHLYGLIIPLPYIMLQQKQKDRETFREVSNTFFSKTIPQPSKSHFKHYLCISKYKLTITDLTIVEYPSLLLVHSFRGSIIPFIVIGNLKSSIYLLSLSWESEL